MHAIGTTYRKSHFQEGDTAGGKESGGGYMKNCGIVAAPHQEPAEGDKKDVKREYIADQGNANEQRVQQRVTQALEERISALVPEAKDAGFKHCYGQQDKK